MFMHCKEKILYIFVFLFFLFSLIENNFKEWLDYLMIASAIHAFFNPYFCKKNKDS